MSTDDRSEFEERVAGALDAYASTIEPAPDAWSRVQGGRMNPTRRNLVAAAAALVVVGAAVVGALALSDDDRPVIVGSDTSTSTTDAPVTSSSASTTTTVAPTTTTVVTSPSIFDDSPTATDFTPLEGAAWQQVLDTAIGLGASSPEEAGQAIGQASIADVSGDIPIEIAVNVATRSADAAVVEITFRRWPDDSINGYDYRIAMPLGTEGWIVSSAESRALCSRGLDSAQNLCV